MIFIYEKEYNPDEAVIGTALCMVHFRLSTLDCEYKDLVGFVVLEYFYI